MENERMNRTDGGMSARKAALVAAILILGSAPARAALTREACLAKKATAWAEYRRCQNVAVAKSVLADADKPTPQDPQGCRTPLLGRIQSITLRAKDRWHTSATPSSPAKQSSAPPNAAAAAASTCRARSTPGPSSVTTAC